MKRISIPAELVSINNEEEKVAKQRSGSLLPLGWLVLFFNLYGFIASILMFHASAKKWKSLQGMRKSLQEMREYSTVIQETLLMLEAHPEEEYDADVLKETMEKYESMKDYSYEERESNLLSQIQSLRFYVPFYAIHIMVFGIALQTRHKPFGVHLALAVYFFDVVRSLYRWKVYGPIYIQALFFIINAIYLRQLPRSQNTSWIWTSSRSNRGSFAAGVFVSLIYAIMVGP
jgi:hypothetical protein